MAGPEKVLEKISDGVKNKKLEGILHYALTSQKITLDEIKANYDESIFSNACISNSIFLYGLI